MIKNLACYNRLPFIKKETEVTPRKKGKKGKLPNLKLLRWIRSSMEVNYVALIVALMEVNFVNGKYSFFLTGDLDLEAINGGLSGHNAHNHSGLGKEILNPYFPFYRIELGFPKIPNFFLELVLCLYCRNDPTVNDDFFADSNERMMSSSLLVSWGLGVSCLV